MFLKNIFNLIADKILENINKIKASNNNIQLAFTMALKVCEKSILVEIYQKHRIVMAIFKNN